MNAKELKKYICDNELVVTILEHINMHHINTLNPRFITCGMNDGDRANSTTVFHKDEYLGVNAYTRNIKSEGQTSQADLINLTAYALNMEYISAKNYLIGFLGLENSGSSRTADPISFFRKSIRKAKRENQRKEQVYYNVDILNNYLDLPHIDLIRKDSLIDLNILKKYHVMFDPRSERIVFPHFKYDDDSIILGLVGRTTNPSFKELNINKYMSLLSTRYDKTLNLYALCWNEKYIKKHKKVIVFEAEKSVMKADMYGLPIGVSVGCHDISEFQKKLLLSLNCEEIIIAFDKDVEEEHLIAQCEKFSKFVNVSYIIDKWNLLDEKDSPVDKGYKRWKFLYEHRVRYNKTK